MDSIWSKPRWGYFLSILALLLGAGLRLWDISNVPPGLYDDEAFHLLNTQEIALGKAFPIYITGNNGNEPLFAYTAVITYWCLGPGVAWTGRLAAAWVGIIGVALTLRAGKELFPKSPVGVLAGFVMATLFWNIHLSRFGSQPILASTAAAGVIAGLASGWRTGKRRAFVLAGVSLAAGLYAYVAFRLFLLVPLLTSLALFVFHPSQRRTVVKGGLILAATALVLYIPLGLFFIQNPQWFFNRYSQTTGEVLGATQPVAFIASNLVKVVGGLFIWGDQNWRHNLAGRPAFDAAQSLFFLIGGGLCAWRWRQRGSMVAIVGLGVGLLPSLVTPDAPHFSRTIMATPPVALLLAQGMVTLWSWLRSRLGRALFVGALLLSPALTMVDYFGRWANDPHLSVAFAVEPARVGQLLHAAPPQARLYGSRQEFGLWITTYLLGPGGLARYRIYDGEQCLVAPVIAEHGAVYAINDGKSLAQLQALFPQGTVLAARALGASMDVFQVPPGETAQFTLATARHIDFGDDAVSLLGYSLPTNTYQSGGEIDLQATWESGQTPIAGGKVFMHLLGAPRADGSTLYSQSDTWPCLGAYPSDQWRPGEFIRETYHLPLPADLAPGEYQLNIGWYLEAGPRLPASDASGQPLGDTVPLETIHIRQP